jgi:kynurenine aminotransferase
MVMSISCSERTDYCGSPILCDSVANLPPDCINLGQGYMNFAPPLWVTEAAELALRNVAANHYSHPKGRIRLREAIKNFYGPQLHRVLDVESEILVTSGANEGKSCSIPTIFSCPY